MPSLAAALAFFQNYRSWSQRALVRQSRKPASKRYEFSPTYTRLHVLNFAGRERRIWVPLASSERSSSLRRERLSHRCSWTFKLPTVAGLVFCGALVGPHALSLASDVHAIEVIAEVGVVFLLFTIGLEFSLTRLSTSFVKLLSAGFCRWLQQQPQPRGLALGAV